jgi:poly(3-hydroxybutyrate) depolymerase
MMRILKMPALLAAAGIILGCASKPVSVDPSAYVENSVLLDAGTYQIPAVVTLPVNRADGAFPAVVMLHGYGSNKDEAGNGYRW